MWGQCSRRQCATRKQWRIELAGGPAKDKAHASMAEVVAQCKRKDHTNHKYHGLPWPRWALRVAVAREPAQHVRREEKEVLRRKKRASSVSNLLGELFE